MQQRISPKATGNLHTRLKNQILQVFHRLFWSKQKNVLSLKGMRPISTKYQNIWPILMNCMYCSYITKKSVRDILNVFPHLMSFEGLQIEKAFEKLNPGYNTNSDLRQIFARGLLIEDDKHMNVHDDCVRGCLRIMAALTRRGIKQKSALQHKNVEDELAAPLIIWIEDTNESLGNLLAKYIAINIESGSFPPPHVVCKTGNYYLFMEGELIACGEDSVQAIDCLFKSFAVFGIGVPTALKKVHEFVEIIGYKLKFYSARLSVRRLTASFTESFKVENIM
ncbi:uncharacterized protein LOC131682867 [Topomyia yanbarensis]|uniref:uncharacterized protein LOC131682867 n=1 Tax=Topomyia yanbarensis TaxID=2498891 RepID=UPI00273AEDF1|nr:uncharacterized protein LOC131682867 [Topomyia yanbarensis]XP_058820621.1 uncharacterized protein LOC131682867 [Topomyia yanbarensis]XP_058820622.1 uncharacterized protein LOC131682867 [Topomyia yanbarensis]